MINRKGQKDIIWAFSFKNRAKIKADTHVPAFQSLRLLITVFAFAGYCYRNVISYYNISQLCQSQFNHSTHRLHRGLDGHCRRTSHLLVDGKL